MAIEGRRYVILHDGTKVGVWIHPNILNDPLTWVVVDGRNGIEISTHRSFEEVSNWVETHRKRKIKNPIVRKIKRHVTW